MPYTCPVCGVDAVMHLTLHVVVDEAGNVIEAPKAYKCMACWEVFARLPMVTTIKATFLEHNHGEDDVQTIELLEPPKEGEQ